jgi:hypothetical protein
MMYDPINNPDAPSTHPWIVAGERLDAWIERNRALWQRSLDDMRTAAVRYQRGAGRGAGVYFLFDDALELLYVGRSVNLPYRLCAHWQRSPFLFKRWSAIALPAGCLDRVEAHYIATFDPPWNVHGR